MTKITTVSKKVLSMIIAMIIALSCMASAFATTEAVKPAAPAAINVAAVFSDVIVIEEIEGCEYAILAIAEDGTVDASKAEYKAESTFKGLEEDTVYAVFARVAATDTEVAGEPNAIQVSTGLAENDPAVEIAEDAVAVS